MKLVHLLRLLNIYLSGAIEHTIPGAEGFR